MEYNTDPLMPDPAPQRDHGASDFTDQARRAGLG